MASENLNSNETTYTFTDCSDTNSTSGTGASVSNTYGYGGYPYGPTPASTWPTTGVNDYHIVGTNINAPACIGGHIADPQEVEHVSGVVTTRCVNCNVRITMGRVPGGVSMLKIKTLLGSVMALNEIEESDTDTFSEILGAYTELMAEVDEEDFQLRQARKLLALVQEMIHNRVVNTSDG